MFLTVAAIVWIVLMLESWLYLIYPPEGGGTSA